MPEELVPERRIEFREIVKMSAKNDAKSVQRLKQKIRIHLDEISMKDEQGKVEALEKELDVLVNADKEYIR